MSYTVRVKGSKSLGEMPEALSEERLSELGPFYRRVVDADSPEAAARQVLDSRGMDPIEEVWVEVDNGWVVYGSDGEFMRYEIPGEPSPEPESI